MRPGASYRSTNEDSKMKRSGSATSVRSRDKKFGVRTGSYSSHGSAVQQGYRNGKLVNIVSIS